MTGPSKRAARRERRDLSVAFRVWISSGGGSAAFGDGKIRILQAIGEEGSLQAAARRLGVSYRKAWGDLKSVEACIGRPLLDRARGGRDGGGSALTDEGRAVVRAYAAFRDDVDASVRRSFRSFLKAL